MQAHEDDALRLLAVAIGHITSCGYTAKVLCLSVLLYCIAENIGRRKRWRIWHIDGQLQKVSPSNLWNIQYPYFIGRPFAKVFSSK